MAVYIDPRTALELARNARADQLREVAEHRRHVEASRADRESPAPDRPTGRRPRAMVSRLVSALRRGPAPA